MSRSWFAWSIPSSWRDAVVEDLQQEARACGRGSFWIAWQCLRTGIRMRLSLGGEEAAREIGYAVRSLGRARTFTATAVLTLALGIGANTVVFSIVESVLLRPFPYPDASDVVLLRGGPTPGSPSGISSSDLEQYRAQATGFSDLAVYSGVRLMSPDSAAPVAVAGVEDRVFRVLGVSPFLGQGLPPGPRLAPLPGESLLAFRDAEPKVVLLSHGFWRSRFGGDPAVIGRTLRLDSVPHEIVGVMPQGFFFPEPAVQLWRLPGPPTVRQLMAVGRLKPGGSIGTAQAEIDVISRRLDEAFPPRATSSEGRRQAVLSPIRDAAVSRYQVVLWLLLGAVGLVLLIACANVANLLLARSVARAKELAIRASLGANRAGLIRQLVTESLLVATLGGILAVGLASVGVRLVLGLGLVDIPRMDSASINVPVLVFAAAVSVVTGLLAGVVPAVTASQVDLTGSLKQGGQTSSQSGHGRFRDALVVAEVGLAVAPAVQGVRESRSADGGGSGLGVTPLLNPNASAATPRPPTRSCAGIRSPILVL